VVWDNNNGIPGNIIYSREEVMVEQGNMINGFYNYTIPEGVVVNGIFYIGWRQRSETFLNAGLDVNTPHAGRQFYWLNGEWIQSQVQGSIMIRPVVGAALKVTPVIDILYHGNKNLINIWPNPATELINIDPGEITMSGLSTITISDIYGRELLKVPFREQINISSLHTGVYFIVTSINGRPVGYNRLIISR
jgi:hypothetical protein